MPSTTPQNWPMSTGQAADFLGVSENRITLQLRLGKIARPPKWAGRYAWSAEDVLKLAKLLDRDSLEIRNTLQKVMAAKFPLIAEARK